MADLPTPLGEPLVVRALRSVADARDNGRAADKVNTLSAGVIGGRCGRRLWYGFRWATEERRPGDPVRGAIGMDFVSRCTSVLRAAGCDVHTHDKSTGKRFRYYRHGGHYVVSIDGAALGVTDAPKAWHCLLVRVVKDAEFRQLDIAGVASAMPGDYCELVEGMAATGMQRGLYVAENESTRELYAERLRWEHVKPAAEAIAQRVQQIVNAADPPPRISDSPDDFRCKGCEHKATCHEDAVPAVSCRTCAHVTPQITGANDARWFCERHRRPMEVNQQRAACHDHLFIPLTISYATPADAGNYDDGTAWVEYTHRDGQTFRNSKRKNEYSSEELTRLPAKLVGAGVVDAVKADFGGDIVSVEAAEFAQSQHCGCQLCGGTGWLCPWCDAGVEYGAGCRNGHVAIKPARCSCKRDEVVEAPPEDPDAKTEDGLFVDDDIPF